MDYYYKQPRYFTKFKCICGDCPENCCRRWSIDWTIDEYEKLRDGNTCDDLTYRIENGFEKIENDNLYRIRLCKDGRCSFQNRDTGLCEIQKNIGEEYLGVVCRTYPRRYTNNDNIILRICNGSCPAVLDLLRDDPRAMEIELTKARDAETLSDHVITYVRKDMLKETPELKYRFIIMDFVYSILSNNKYSFETSAIMAALGMKHISDLVEKKEFGKIERTLKDLKAQLMTASTARSLDAIKPNYQLKFKLVNNMIVKHLGTDETRIDISVLHDGKELITENYLKGIENFNKTFEGKEYYLRNIALNMLLELRIPFFLKGKTLLENYNYYLLCVEAIKTIAAAVGFVNDDIDLNFRLSASEILRSIVHNNRCANDVIDDMKSLGLTTPAHIALIIK